MAINESDQFWQHVEDAKQNTSTVFAIMQIDQACYNAMQEGDTYIAAMHAETAMGHYRAVAGIEKKQPERNGLDDSEINGVLKSLCKAGYGFSKDSIEKMVKECRRLINIRNVIIERKKQQAIEKAKYRRE